MLKLIFPYSVDNILVKIGDPLFTGYCIEMKAECANKVVCKGFPTESVGITCKVNGKYQVCTEIIYWESRNLCIFYFFVVYNHFCLKLVKFDVLKVGITQPLYLSDIWLSDCGIFRNHATSTLIIHFCCFMINFVKRGSI